MRIKAKHILYAGAFIVLTIIGIFLVPKNEEIIISNSNGKSGDINSKVETIFVHIDGAINEPGIKVVPKYTRLFELIELSGGTKENADISRLNLASVLKDEQKVVIPEKINEENSKESITYSSKTINSGIVNINSADKEGLSTLPGIGPAMAQRIIDYRNNNGMFNDIEDIKNVTRYRWSKIWKD